MQTFLNKTEFETDTIIDFLKQENINYRTRLVKSGIIDIYNIEVDTDFNHYMFIKKIADDKLKPYFTAMKSFCLPSYERDDEICEEMPITLKIDGVTVKPFDDTEIMQEFKIKMPPKIEIKEYKRESLLYKIIKKWMK